jgi:hypothetical protein
MMNLMNTSTLTIRLPQAQREALKRTARALKKSESEYVRDLLVRDLAAVPFGQRAAHLAGSLDSRKVADIEKDPFRKTIRRNNWRPA